MNPTLNFEHTTFRHDNYSKKILYIRDAVGYLKYVKESTELSDLINYVKNTARLNNRIVTYEIRTGMGEIIERGVYYG